ncbi:MAG: hypothetical protein ACD_47C00647G0001 [uncultured bacterium]|nr:MAG: hypothetical protein ACD_47C00647G0001 [uncultured bacterium]
MNSRSRADRASPDSTDAMKFPSAGRFSENIERLLSFNPEPSSLSVIISLPDFKITFSMRGGMLSQKTPYFPPSFSEAFNFTSPLPVAALS